jgi:ADP-ribose pyrophosphatase YjhB (NUDIX family)
VARELMEEMGIELKELPRLLGIYSDPPRDNRRHAVSAAFVVKVPQDVRPRAGDKCRRCTTNTLS